MKPRIAFVCLVILARANLMYLCVLAINDETASPNSPITKT